MLIGEHKHTLDTKKRLSLPAKFRKELGKQVIISKGLDSCVFLYSLNEWKKFEEKLNGGSVGQEEVRSIKRFVFGSAALVDIDSAGRILIPDFIKDFAGLKEKVVVLGVGDKVELWDEKKWKAIELKNDKESAALAQRLGDSGKI